MFRKICIYYVILIDFVKETATLLKKQHGTVQGKLTEVNMMLCDDEYISAELTCSQLMGHQIVYIRTIELATTY